MTANFWRKLKKQLVELSPFLGWDLEDIYELDTGVGLAVSKMEKKKINPRKVEVGGFIDRRS